MNISTTIKHRTYPIMDTDRMMYPEHYPTYASHVVVASAQCEHYQQAEAKVLVTPETHGDSEFMADIRNQLEVTLLALDCATHCHQACVNSGDLEHIIHTPLST